MNAQVKEDLTDRKLQPGDRVEMLPGNVFGIVVECQGLKFLLRLEDGSKRWCSRQSFWYSPSKLTVQQRATAIRSEWSQTVRHERQQESQPVTIPLIHDEWDASRLEYGKVI